MIRERSKVTRTITIQDPTGYYSYIIDTNFLNVESISFLYVSYIVYINIFIIFISGSSCLLSLLNIDRSLQTPSFFSFNLEVDFIFHPQLVWFKHLLRIYVYVFPFG